MFKKNEESFQEYSWGEQPKPKLNRVWLTEKSYLSFCQLWRSSFSAIWFGKSGRILPLWLWLEKDSRIAWKLKVRRYKGFINYSRATTGNNQRRSTKERLKEKKMWGNSSLYRFPGILHTLPHHIALQFLLDTRFTNCHLPSYLLTKAIFSSSQRISSTKPDSSQKSKNRKPERDFTHYQSQYPLSYQSSYQPTY